MIIIQWEKADNSFVNPQTGNKVAQRKIDFVFSATLH
jgi:hypothetical protein